ncbi:MAG: hypothetical protein ACK55Z_22530, partial [bacterium]
MDQVPRTDEQELDRRWRASRGGAGRDAARRQFHRAGRAPRHLVHAPRVQRRGRPVACRPTNLHGRAAAVGFCAPWVRPHAQQHWYEPRARHD